MILSLKLISVFIGILYLSVAISSYTSSSNSQAYASLNNEINESIKKACPTYEGNGGIDGLVSDILKACLDRGNTSQPPTEPNPEPNPSPGSLTQNILQLQGRTEYQSDGIPDVPINLIVQDTTSNLMTSYDASDASFHINDNWVIPVGDNYVISVTNNQTGSVTFPISVSYISTDCQVSGDVNSCSGTMDTSPQNVQFLITVED